MSPITRPPLLPLHSENSSKPTSFFFWLLALLIRSGLTSEELLLDCPCMESLGRCRCLLCSGQRVSEPDNGLGLLLDLSVFHFKLPL